jgi:hypothetical protein
MSRVFIGFVIRVPGLMVSQANDSLEAIISKILGE